jgi:alpha-tubulin suppressor-like RCC1 family protein
MRGGARLSWASRQRLGLAVLAACLLPVAGCLADPAPSIGPAIAGDGRAMVSWEPPIGDNALTLTAYVVTPYVGDVAQPPVRFNSTATTQTVTGLTNGTAYTFTVHAINALGHGTARSARSNPVTPLSVSIAAGYAHTCAITTGGTLKCWGDNSSGQLGNGTSADSTTPAQVTGISGAVAITAGYAHACALVAAGGVRCWGENGSGQLGDGGLTDRRTPVSVTGISGAVAIGAGFAHTCAVVADGAVKCWGSNYRGQLGNGTTTSSTTPVPVTGLTGAVAVTAGLGHTCALLSGGTIRCWGANYTGALGNGTTVGSAVPVPVTGLSGVADVAAGGSASEALHTCAVLADGTGTCWGSNQQGQLGNATTSDGELEPVSVVGLEGASVVTAGDNHTCAVVASRAVSCWGRNVSGQLGNGTTGGSSTPVWVLGLEGATVVTAGDYHTCAIAAGGAVSCWGSNASGQLGDGTTTNSPTPVAVVGL